MERTVSEFNMNVSTPKHIVGTVSRPPHTLPFRPQTSEWTRANDEVNCNWIFYSILAQKK